jgi:2-isopropylmalate synthase
LRDSFKGGESVYTFKERVEIAKVLDKLHVDRICLSPIENVTADTMIVRTMAAVVKNSVLSMPVDFTVESVDLAWNAVSVAKYPELLVAVPTSAVQMEYICHKKAPKIMEMISELVSTAKAKCPRVNFAAVDATRSDLPTLAQAIKTAIAAGACEITLCDSAGTFLPDEMAAFIADVKAAVPEIGEGIAVNVQCSNALSVGAASAVAALKDDAVCGVCVTVGGGESAPSLSDMAQIMRIKGDDLDCSCGIKTTELQRSLRQLGLVEKIAGGDRQTVDADSKEDFVLDKNDDMTTVAKATRKLGYDLSDEDISKVYESFCAVAQQKTVDARELDAIIASVALQVPPTYRLVSYVINSGSNISSTANIQVEKEGQMISEVCAGFGPIDAAFLAIDAIVGTKYELDDFQIQSVTEGKEAMGSALVRLRAGGKLYSGTGISTDIIAASIRAYVNAINKIAYEQKI